MKIINKKAREPKLYPFPILLAIFSIISHSTFYQTNAITSSNIVRREALSIIIGGGTLPPTNPPEYGDCPECPQPPEQSPECPPPPPPPECPPPLPPPPPPPPSPPPLPPPNPPKSAPSSDSVPFELRNALNVIQKFKQTITYDPFGYTKTWRGDKICKDPNAYKGFICDTTISDNKIRVALVNFNGFNLNGNPLLLTNFLEGLTDIIVFHANSNNFTGTVPTGISKIPNLFELDLSNNKLKGNFPPAILTATNLTFLDVRFNQLTGKLPPQVFTLDLDVLFLNNNGFVGTIPKNLWNTSARYLTLANNKFQGKIPKTTGQTSDTLVEILLLNNQLSGCLPYQIGLLKKATLFDASMNIITGPIPHSFGCLESLQIMNVSYNRLYGAIPESLCKLRDLSELTLKFNYITQVGPECRRLIREKKLDVSMNCVIDLPMQRSVKDCGDFFLKQETCPDQRSMFYVPCKKNYNRTPRESTVNRKLMGELPRSYAALTRP